MTGRPPVADICWVAGALSVVSVSSVFASSLLVMVGTVGGSPRARLPRPFHGALLASLLPAGSPPVTLAGRSSSLFGQRGVWLQGPAGPRRPGLSQLLYIYLEVALCGALPPLCAPAYG